MGKKRQRVKCVPVKGSTVKGAGIKDDLAKATPVETAPVKATPAENQPAKAAADKIDAMKTAPVDNDPIKAAPNKVEPNKTDPAKTAPNQADSVKAASVKAASTISGKNQHLRSSYAVGLTDAEMRKHADDLSEDESHTAMSAIHNYFLVLNPKYEEEKSPVYDLVPAIKRKVFTDWNTHRKIPIPNSYDWFKLPLTLPASYAIILAPPGADFDVRSTEFGMVPKPPFVSGPVNDCPRGVGQPAYLYAYFDEYLRQYLFRWRAVCGCPINSDQVALTSAEEWPLECIRFQALRTAERQCKAMAARSNTTWMVYYTRCRLVRFLAEEAKLTLEYRRQFLLEDLRVFIPLNNYDLKKYINEMSRIFLAAEKEQAEGPNPAVTNYIL